MLHHLSPLCDYVNIQLASIETTLKKEYYKRVVVNYTLERKMQ